MFGWLDSFPSHGYSETHVLGLTGACGQRWKERSVERPRCSVKSSHQEVAKSPVLTFHWWELSPMASRPCPLESYHPGRKGGWIWADNQEFQPQFQSVELYCSGGWREADLFSHTVRKPCPVVRQHLSWSLVLWLKLIPRIFHRLTNVI